MGFLIEFGEGLAKKAQKDLQECILEYLPFASCAVGCGIGKDRKGWFVCVNLARKLPKGVTLPSHFMGMRVVSKVVGKIVKQRK